MPSVVALALILALHPYKVPPMPPATAGSARFRVDVSGRAGQVVRLHAVGVPDGFIASFCTRRVCAPFAVTLALPPSGRDSIELQLIQNVPGSRRPALVRVAAPGARTASIAFARGR